MITQQLESPGDFSRKPNTGDIPDREEFLGESKGKRGLVHPVTNVG